MALFQNFFLSFVFAFLVKASLFMEEGDLRPKKFWKRGGWTVNLVSRYPLITYEIKYFQMFNRLKINSSDVQCRQSSV